MRNANVLVVLSLAGSGLLLVGCAGGEPEPAADPVEQFSGSLPPLSDCAPGLPDGATPIW